MSFEQEINMLFRRKAMKQFEMHAYTQLLNISEIIYGPVVLTYF